MIHVIDGAPGAGKTYWLVNELISKYYKKEGGTWKYKKTEIDGREYEFIVYTNIEGLRLPHEKIDDLLKEHGIDFFTYNYQQKLVEKLYDRKIIYCIDECQRYLDDRIDKKKEVIYFFEYHRHLGLEMYLLTQTYNRLSRRIQGLEEFYLHAPRRVTSLFGEFTYQIKSGYEIIDKIHLRKKEEIFRLYKSMDQQSVHKHKNPLRKYMLLVIIAVLVTVPLFFKVYKSHWGEKEKKKDKGIQVEKNVTVSSIENKEKTETQKKERIKRIPVRVSFIGNLQDMRVINYETGDLMPMDIMKALGNEYYVMQNKYGDITGVYQLMDEYEMQEFNEHRRNLSENETDNETGVLQGR